jgi:hypothetical protein
MSKMFVSNTKFETKNGFDQRYFAVQTVSLFFDFSEMNRQDELLASQNRQDKSKALKVVEKILIDKVRKNE